MTKNNDQRVAGTQVVTQAKKMSERETKEKWNRRYREGCKESFAPVKHPLADTWGHMVSKKPMLDAACGLGRGIASAGEVPEVIYGVDISEQAILKARQIWQADERIRWVVADVSTLPWPENHFGLICSFGFTHIEFLSSVPRLLAPGGMVWYEGFLKREVEVRPSLDPRWTTSPEEMALIFSELEILSMESAQNPPYRLTIAAKRKENII